MNSSTGALREDEVHVWRARLQLSGAVLHRLYCTLSPDEKSRALKFRFPGDRCRFIARRGILRRLLSRYTSMDPVGVELQRSEQGKLRIAERQGSQVRFNLSHSKGFAIFAITRGREVGIDIEQVDGTSGWRDVAKVFFTPREQEVISRLPADRQTETFFEIWTRKEAILKALGLGLQFDPAHIDVAGNDALGKEITLLHEDRPWKLFSLSADGFAATLAAPSNGWRVQRHDWTVE